MKNQNTERKLKYKTFIGVDEVGRGCLAGPVTASAVFVKKEDIGKISGVHDSKKVSKKQREHLYEQIVNAHLYKTIFVDNVLVDRINIHNASLLAMKLSVENLRKKAELIIVDGCFDITDISDHQKSFKKADQLFYSVAAASIVAKVERDRLMEDLNVKYPNYSFAKHRGYGTRLHKEEIRKYGI